MIILFNKTIVSNLDILRLFSNNLLVSNHFITLFPFSVVCNYTSIIRPVTSSHQHHEFQQQHCNMFSCK